MDQGQNRLSADYADYGDYSRIAGEDQGQKLVSRDPPYNNQLAGNAALFSRPEGTEFTEKTHVGTGCAGEVQRQGLLNREGARDAEGSRGHGAWGEKPRSKPLKPIWTRMNADHTVWRCAKGKTEGKGW